jgi:signal transduction histidine kinase
MKKQVLCAMMLLAIFCFASCSKPPEAEMQSAEASIQAANSAEAQEYAPETYQKAMDAMNSAKAAKEEQDAKFALFRKYGPVKESYMSAKTLADQAKAEAETEKERVAAEVRDLVVQTQAVIDSAAAALETAPRGKGSKAEIELMKASLESVRESFTQAQADVNAGKFLVAKSKLQAVQEKARGIMAEIEAAKGVKGS